MIKFCKKKMFWILLVVFFSIVFKTNFIDSFNRVQNFQYGSEDLAIGALAAEHYHVRNGWQGLGRLITNEPNYKWGSEKIYKENRQTNKGLRYAKYNSQIGLQGKIYAKISKFTYSKVMIGCFRWLNCFFLSAVLVYLCYLLKEKFGNLFASIWGIVFLLSPWIVNFAPNLYWVEFTWFLPMLIGVIAVSDKVQFKYKNWALCLCIFISVGIKAACGYEYLSTILIAMIMFPLTDLLQSFFSNKDYHAIRNNLKIITMFSLSALLAFCVIFSVHGKFRGNGDISQGIKNIYHQDILRRTVIGNQQNFKTQHQGLKKSINATVPEVLQRYFDFYLNAYHSNIVLGLDGRYFNTMSVLVIILLLLRYRKTGYLQIFKDQHFYLLLLSLIATLSWLILAKSHSYVHVHMNYVLWYFGYVQMCLFIIVNDGLIYLRKFCNRV